MAHWSTGYADFHEELHVEPPTPITPPPLRCGECGVEQPDLHSLREHVVLAHPVARPVLMLCGRPCGDIRLLVQRPTSPSDWSALACTSLTIDQVDLPLSDLADTLSASTGLTTVELGNGRSTRKYRFDFTIPAATDLRGVDTELQRLLGNGVVDQQSINDFYERARGYRSAKNYAGGVAQYLYWAAASDRDSNGDSRSAAGDKLNDAAHLLRDVERPLARAITALIAFHHNHFDEAAARALSPRLREVAARLDTMLKAEPAGASARAVVGKLSHLERMLIDKQNALLLDFCAGSLDDSRAADLCPDDAQQHGHLSQFKRVMFQTEGYLIRRDARVNASLQEASRNGLPERWVEARLDYIAHRGTT